VGQLVIAGFVPHEVRPPFGALEFFFETPPVWRVGNQARNQKVKLPDLAKREKET